MSLVACGGSGADRDASVGGDFDAPVGPVFDSGPSFDAENCQPPDMLIVLDRTMSMHRRPNGSRPEELTKAESKWYLAIESLEAVTASLDETIRFGLALFPLDPGDDSCVTLSERIANTTATNTACEAGEIAVSPAIDTGDAIDSALHPDTTLLCTSTPIGAGLGTAQLHLASIADPIRDQYALLLTDGQDTCSDPLVMSSAHALAAAGVSLFVVGFDASGGTGVDHAQLNHLACAGHTAVGFPTPCTDDGSGNYTATDPDGAQLYILAENAADLTMELETVAGQICCNCVE